MDRRKNPPTKPITRQSLYAATIISGIFSSILSILISIFVSYFLIVPHIPNPPPSTPSPIAKSPTPIISYPSFTNNDDGLVRNGSATIASTSLELTPAVYGDAGSAYYKNPIDASKSFETQFQFSLHDGTSHPADGFTFIIQSAGSSALGGGGNRLGCGGIKPSLAVEFDIFGNSVGDSDGSRIDVTNNCDPSTLINPPGPISPPFSLYGSVFKVWINYDAGSHSLKVYVTPGGGGTQPTQPPSSPLITSSIDFNNISGLQNPYVGFTGGTGQYGVAQDILNWNFSYQ